MPKISVIMSVYNDKNYVDKAIKSILKQTFKDFEFIITDDASTDNSSKIIEKYAKKDDRIKFIKNAYNIGLTKSLNNMIDIADGKYIARMDADDISVADRLEQQLKVFKEEKVDVVFSDTFLIDHLGKDVCSSWRPNKLSKILNLMDLINFIPHPTVMIRREIFDKYGNYNPNFETGQDKELWQRLINNKVNFYYLNKTLLMYRINPNSVRVNGDANINYKLANTCISNKNRLKTLNYIHDLSLKEKIIIFLKILTPYKVLFYKGLFFRKYFKGNKK